jgi:hypothetical protein
MDKQTVINDIITECKKQGIILPSQWAYIIATVQHETAGSFKPVKEAYFRPDAENWRKANLRYYPYYGRGFVQLTWKKNYAIYSQKTGIDLVNDPDRALDYTISIFILIDGFNTGTFTGLKISDFINESKTDFLNARKCINGLDCAKEIGLIAIKYLKELNK